MRIGFLRLDFGTDRFLVQTDFVTVWFCFGLVLLQTGCVTDWLCYGLFLLRTVLLRFGFVKPRAQRAAMNAA